MANPDTPAKYHVVEAHNSAIGDNAFTDNTGGNATREPRPSTAAPSNSSYRIDKVEGGAVGDDATVINHSQDGALAAHFTDRLERVLVTRIEQLLDTRNRQLIADLLPLVQAESAQLTEELEILYVRLSRRLRHMQQLPQLRAQQPELANQLDATVDAIDQPQLSGRHRLKVALPIVPNLVWFESEVEVGQSSELLALWDQFLAYWGRSAEALSVEGGLSE